MKHSIYGIAVVTKYEMGSFSLDSFNFFDVMVPDCSSIFQAGPDQSLISLYYTIKAAPLECVIRTGQP